MGVNVFFGIKNYIKKAFNLVIFLFTLKILGVSEKVR